MNRFIFSDIVYSLSYFDTNVSKVLSKNISTHLYNKLLVINENLEEKEYLIDDKRHREDGPAIEYFHIGHKEWYQNGKLHRVDGPAVESMNDLLKWYQCGELHRVDGPAVEVMSSGCRFWYQCGKLHRLDGPAIERPDGNDEWWQSGCRIYEHKVV